MKKVILASASPRRQQLLQQMGVQFDVVVADVDEKSIDNMPPDELVQALAHLKANAVANEIKEDAIVIGADTIVALGEEILGKPRDSEDAKKMLGMLSGKKHTVYTGVALIDVKSKEQKIFVVDTDIYMKKMSSKEIDDYVATGEPLDKAGSYGIQGRGAVFVEKIKGDYFTVMGLPISKLYDCLKN